MTNIRSDKRKDIKENEDHIQMIYQDIRLKNKYDNLGRRCAKIMPYLIQKSKSKVTTNMMDQLRRHLPKAWFRIIKIQTKTVKSNMTAIKFKANIENGIISESISIADYIRGLYKDPKPSGFRVTREPDDLERIIISDEMME